MELYPGLHMIHAPFEGDRYINLWLFGATRLLLVDSGVAGVPEEVILPYLAGLGLSPKDIERLVNLHAHADHIGGNAELAAASGNALRIGAHMLDAPAIADHRLLATQVYRLTEEQLIRRLIRRCGVDVPVSERYQGGESIDLEGQRLQVLHTPGHTVGNLAVYDRANRALVHGESVMGPAETDSEGRRSTPFGQDPAQYRRTLERLRGLDFRFFLSSHRPPTNRSGGLALIEESLAAVERYEGVCRHVLADGIQNTAEMGRAVAKEGRYQYGERLVGQVAHTLENWLKSAEVVQGATGGYTLVR